VIRCTVGVLAHNEAQNVGTTLRALLAQRVQTVEIVEIIVIASGCTDSTVEIVERVADAHPIVTVEIEAERSGKAAAIRRLMRVARGDVIVLANADTIPEANAVEHLVHPFSNKAVGMTGARVIPLNIPRTWLGFTVQMLWHVHHHLALRKAKLGELVAFRNVIENFPTDTSTDEPAIEALIAAKGLRLVYTPNAIVYNRGPERAGEFVVQRRRVFAGQVRIALRYRYFTSSLQLRYVVPIAMQAINSYPQFLLWTVAAIAVEGWARILGLYDALGGQEHPIWRHAASTKAVTTTDTESLTLISLRWAPGTLNANAFLRDLRRHSDDAGSVFWWDGSQGEVLLFVGGESPLDWFQHQIESVTRRHTRRHPVYSNTSRRLSVSWVKPQGAADRSLVSSHLVKFSSPALN